jgi:Flp pilus assembly protein TadD
VITESAEPAEKEEAAVPAPTVQPAPAEMPPTFHGKVARGHQLYLAGNHGEALSAYELAKEMEPGNPFVYYLIGCTLAKLERFDDARVTLKTASTLASGKDEALNAKALFAIAVIEDNRGRLDEAETAWTEYQGFAQTHGAIETFIGTAEDRLKAIEARRKLDEQYAVVRERIGKSD